jgi:hypothetical protein
VAAALLNVMARLPVDKRETARRFSGKSTVDEIITPAPGRFAARVRDGTRGGTTDPPDVEFAATLIGTVGADHQQCGDRVLGKIPRSRFPVSA